MQTTREQLNGLFVALEMPMAAKWTEKRLMDKIKKLPEAVDEDTDAGEYQELLDELLEAVSEKDEIEITEDEAPAKKKKTTKKKTTAKKAPAKKKAAAKEEEEYEDAEEEEEEEEEEEAPKPKRSRKKVAPKKAKAEVEEDVEDDEEEDDEEEAKPKSKKKAAAKKSNNKKATNKAPKTPKAPGVIASIAEFLKKATGKKPISKDALCEKLAERFPERDPDSMMRTINVQVPNRLKSDKGLVVKKNDKGYWIED